MFPFFKVFLGQSAVQQASIHLAQVHQVLAHSILAIIGADTTVTSIIHGSIGWARQRVIPPAAMTQVFNCYIVSKYLEWCMMSCRVVNMTMFIFFDVTMYILGVMEDHNFDQMK
jgi:hypothetical protein